MPTAEQHNRLRAQAYAVLVMDHLRDRTAVGEEVTLWSLNRDLCERYRIHGQKREYQYRRTRRTVMELELAGLVQTEKRWEKDTNRYTKLIRICSVQ